MATRYVATFQPVNKDLAPRFHGLKGDVFSRVPKSQYDDAARVCPSIWEEHSSYDRMIKEIKSSFPDAICIIFDRYDDDQTMTEVLRRAFDGTLDVEAHNSFRGIH